VRPDDPRADPTVVDLIELAGLWLAASDWTALSRTLSRLDAELTRRFPADVQFAERFRELAARLERFDVSRSADAEELRRVYRRATLG
jgi:hypothetical protein